MATFQPHDSILQSFPVLNLTGDAHRIPGRAAEDSFNNFKISRGCKQLYPSDPQSGALKTLHRVNQSIRWLPLISFTMRILKAKFHCGSQLKLKLTSPRLHSPNPAINSVLNCLPCLALKILVAPSSLPRCHPLSRGTLGESLTVHSF